MLWYELVGGTETQRWATIRTYKNSPGIVVSQLLDGRVRIGISNKHTTHLFGSRNADFGTHLVPFAEKGGAERRSIQTDRFRCNVCGELKYGLYDMADHHSEVHFASTMNTFLEKERGEKMAALVSTVLRRPYTQNEIEKMTSLYRSGQTAGQIAKMLNRTKAGVQAALAWRRITKFRPSSSAWASKTEPMHFLDVKRKRKILGAASHAHTAPPVLGARESVRQEHTQESLVALLHKYQALTLEIAAVTEQIRVCVTPLLTALEQVR